MAQNLSLQLFRNEAILANFEAAKSKLEGFTSADRKDGEAIICRYYEGESTNQVVKTALGLYYVNGTTVKCTILKDAVAMEEDFKKVIESLDVTDSEVDGSVVVKVDQEDGEVSNTKKAIKDIKLVGYVSTGEDGSLQIAATDTIGDALNKIETYIKGLDYTSAPTNGAPIVVINQTNGKLSDIAAGHIWADYVHVKDSESDVESAKTVNDAITELKKNQVTNADGTISVSTSGNTTDVKVNVKSGEKVIKVDASKNGIYTELTLAKVENTEANVKEAFELKSGDEKLGDTIKIYKDSSLLSVKLLHAEGDTKPSYDKTSGWTDIASAKQTEANLALCFAYETANGTITVEAIPVGDFLRESEFKNGLEVSESGEVSVKVKQGDKYLTVNADGIASKDIDKAISDAIETALGGEDSKPVDEQIEDALEELTVAEVGGNGKVIQKISQTNGKISATPIDLNGTNVSVTPVGSDGLANTVQGALEELHGKISSVSSEAITVKQGNGISITGETSEKTIAVKVKDNDPLLEVTSNGLGIKSNAVLDCGTY